MSEPTYNTAWPGYQQQYPGQQPYPTAPAPAGYGGQPPVPPSNAGWAVVAILFFWPVAFSAFNHLHDIVPKWLMGDYQGAQYASERVKALGKIALWVGIGLMVFAFVMWFAAFATFAAAVNEIDSSYNTNPNGW